MLAAGWFVAFAVAFALLVQEKRRAPDTRNKFWASLRALPVNFRRYLVGVGVFGLMAFCLVTQRGGRL